MFFGRITNELGVKLVEAGPYTDAEDLVSDLLFWVPKETWKEDYELSLWKVAD